MKKAPSASLSKFALAGGLVAGTATVAHASVILTSVNQTISPNPNTNTLSFNLTTGVFVTNGTNSDSQFQVNYDGTNGATTKPRLQGISGQPATVLATGTSQANGNKVINNAPGTLISADSGGADTTGRSFYGGATGVPYLSFTEDATSQFIRGQTGYAGVQIIDPVNSSQVDYGYIAITLGQDYSITINELAYDNTGSGITVVAVPEPSTYATSLLALGGAATALVARRRRAAKASVA